MCVLRINRADMLKEANSAAGALSPGFNSYSASDSSGSFGEKVFLHNHLRVTETVADFERECSVSVEDPLLPEYVQIYFPLSGAVTARYPSSGLVTQLRRRRFQRVYVPEAGYEWGQLTKVRLVRIDVRKDYFTGLLAGDEAWSASLREKLLRSEACGSAEGVICSRMQRIVHDLLDTQLSGYLQKIFMEAKVLELIALHLNHCRHEQRERRWKLKKKDAEILATIYEDLSKNFRQEHSLRQLARAYGLNEFTLKKGFKELFGKTVFDYLLELKMNYAKQLLLEEGKLVCEVSREVGYKNPNHFSTAFKKKFGFNPVLLRN